MSQDELKQIALEQRFLEIDRLIESDVGSSIPSAGTETETILADALMRISGYAAMWEFARDRSECEEIILKCLDAARAALSRTGYE